MLLNVLIVDDEAPIRGGIKLKADWESLGMRVAGEAGDGKEALGMILSGGFDIVITDISMPVMDGLELIRFASEAENPAKFVIVSGYGEFEYARTAMRYGISEYLLKPVKETELRDSLLAVKEEIQSSERIRRQERERREKLKLKEESLLHWLSDKNASRVPDDVEREWKRELQAGRFLTAVVKIETAGVADEDPERKSRLVPYPDIETACGEFAAGEGNGTVVKSIRQEHEFILLLHPADDGLESLARGLAAFVHRLQERFGVRATVGIGGVRDRAAEIPASYREALFAVKERLLLGTGKAIDYASIRAKGDKPNFGADTKLLAKLLKEKKWDKAKEQIEQSFRRAASSKQIRNHVHASELFFELYFAIKQFAQEEAASPESAAEGAAAGIADVAAGFGHLDQMVDWLYQYLEESCRHLIEGQDATGKEIVYRVQAYIKDFCSAELTLNMVSEKYHINPIYFSRIFKAYTGESFNGYTTRIRMEEAKRLLETTSLRQQEISEIVGYEDPKYFSKVFKKFFGISPSQYTENRPSEPAAAGSEGGIKV